MRGAQEERNIANRHTRQQGQCLRFDLQDLFAVELRHRHVIFRQQPILGRILLERERILINEFRSCHISYLTEINSKVIFLFCRRASVLTRSSRHISSLTPPKISLPFSKGLESWSETSPFE